MTAGVDIQNAMTIARSAPVMPPHAMKDEAGAKKAAQQFEGVFI